MAKIITHKEVIKIADIRGINIPTEDAISITNSMVALIDDGNRMSNIIKPTTQPSAVFKVIRD
jgi:hypothetical protein